MATENNRPAELETLREGLARLAPPEGMQQRVWNTLQQGRKTRRRPRPLRLALILIPATALAAGTYHHLRKPDPLPRPPPAAGVAPAPACAPLPRPPVTRRPEPRTAGPAERPAPATATPCPREVKQGGLAQHRQRPTRRRPVVAPGVKPRGAARAPVKGDSELAAQVAAYRQALALGRRDQVAALASFEAMRQRWSRGSMMHEVDLRIIEALLKLNRLPQAREEARRFLRRHPQSPQRTKVEAVLTAEKK